MEETYFSRVNLLLAILPDVMRDPRLALKGGTAINLFTLNMPRLSVDIDLTYLPIEDRPTSLKSIDQIFMQIKERITARGFVVQPKFTAEDHIKQLTVEDRDDLVKVEVNHILRGGVYPPIQMNLSSKAQATFNKFVAVQCLAEHDLFAGKICAALDRQHPRDLYDMHFFLENKTYTRDLHDVFLVYLISNNRPISELIKPNQQDISDLYNNEFLGMADFEIPLPQLYETFRKIVMITQSSMTHADKEFLLSFKAGEPKWNLLAFEHVANLPAIRWKLYNIHQMTPEKHKEMLKKLEDKLS